MRAERRRWLRMAAALLAAQMGFLRDALAAGSVERGVHRVRVRKRRNS